MSKQLYLIRAVGPLCSDGGEGVFSWACPRSGATVGVCEISVWAFLASWPPVNPSLRGGRAFRGDGKEWAEALLSLHRASCHFPVKKSALEPANTAASPKPGQSCIQAARSMEEVVPGRNCWVWGWGRENNKIMLEHHMVPENHLKMRLLDFNPQQNTFLIHKNK